MRGVETNDVATTDWPATSYLSTAFVPSRRREAIDKTVAFLSYYRREFDCIAFRGMSGALVAPAVADALGKGLILVRKENDNSHASMSVEGFRSQTRYVVVDDFVQSGETIRTIYDRIKQEAFAENPVPLFVVEYARWRTADDTVRLTDEIYVRLHGVEDVSVGLWNKLARVGNILGI